MFPIFSLFCDSRIPSLDALILLSHRTFSIPLSLHLCAHRRTLVTTRLVHFHLDVVIYRHVGLSPANVVALSILFHPFLLTRF